MKPPINLGQVETLKQKLLAEADLGVFWDFYFTYFAEHPDFMTMSQKTRNERVEKLISLVGQQITGRSKTRAKHVSLMEVPEYGLIHGTAFLEEKLAAVLYFPEMKAGVVAVMMGGAGQMVYARLQEPVLEKLKPASKRLQ